MIAKIDRDGCISCGMCVEICPEVFHMTTGWPTCTRIPSRMKRRRAPSPRRRAAPFRSSMLSELSLTFYFSNRND